MVKENCRGGVLGGKASRAMDDNAAGKTLPGAAAKNLTKEEKAVLLALHEVKRGTMQEIADQTGLTLETVSDIVRNLKAKGFIRERDSAT